MMFSWAKLGLASVPVLILVSTHGCAYLTGSKHGKAYVQAQWDKDSLEKHKLFVKIKDLTIQTERDHQNKDRIITDELANLKANKATDIARIRGDAALRVRESAKRATVYQRMSEGSAVERANLSSHAAQLDRTIAEGIGLVEEFQSTLELRDGQLKALGAQILNDRQLMNGTGSSNESDAASVE